MNIMKLLQERRSLAEVINRRFPARTANPMLLQLRQPSWRIGSAKAKRSIRIDMQDPEDIPHPVSIIVKSPSTINAADSSK